MLFFWISLVFISVRLLLMVLVISLFTDLFVSSLLPVERKECLHKRTWTHNRPALTMCMSPVQAGYTVNTLVTNIPHVG